VLCDTYSVSSSRGVIVTLVQVRERHRPLPQRRGVIPHLQSAWRLLRGSLRSTPRSFPANGTGPLASPGAACFSTGVRPAPPFRDDWYELTLLLPHTMRQTC
jgi:hypothetical protein